MTFEQLRYVLEVERTGSINKAASNLFMSQSALSLAIQSLEKELGDLIFSRTNKGVIPTPFGRSFIKYLVPIQMQLDQVNKIFTQGGSANGMSFTLANDGFTCGSMICGMLYRKYRSIGLRIEHYDSYGDQARSMVADQVAEVGLIRIWSCHKKIEMRQMDTLGIEFHPLYEGSLAVQVGPGNPLYHDPTVEFVTPDMMEQFPRVKYGYEDRGPLSDSVIELGIHDKVVPLVTSSRAVINDMLTYSDAYYITTDFSNSSVCQRVMRQKRLLPLKGVDIRSTVGWIGRRNVPLGHIALEFTKLVEQWFRGEISEATFCEGL